MISSARQWCFGLRCYRLCVGLVSREDGFPTDVCGLQVPWYCPIFTLPGLWGSWCRTALHSVCTPALWLTLAYGSTVSVFLFTSSLDLHLWRLPSTVADFSLRVPSVCCPDYFITGSLHRWRLQPARFWSLAFTRILYVDYRHRPTHLIIPVAQTATSSGHCS